MTQDTNTIDYNKCFKSIHWEHERIKNWKYDYCICCSILRKHIKPSLQKVKRVLIISE